MRKITFLFCALLLCCIGAVAQTAVTSVDGLSNDKIYTLKSNRGDGKGYLMYHTSAPNNVASNYGSGYSDVDYALTEPAYQWAIYKSPKTNKYYFYSVKGNKFIGTSVDGDSKAVKLETAPTNDVEIRTSEVEDYPFLLSTSQWALNTAQTSNCHGVVSWAGGYNEKKDGGNVYQITEAGDITADMKSAIAAAVTNFEDKVDVTFIYNIDGREYDRTTVEHSKGIALSVPARDFVTVIGTNFTGDVVTGATTVNVDCTPQLPFIPSDDKNTYWYVIDMHKYDTGTPDVMYGTLAYMWTYDADSKEIRTPKTSEIMTGLSDNMLWCVKGNLIDGFTIYNKAAGWDMKLRKAKNGNTVSVMSSETDRNQFKLYKTRLTNYGEAVCFKLDGDDYYLNKQEFKLKGWTDNDGGSSCRFFTPAHFPLNLSYVAVAPSGAVGSYTYAEDKAKREELMAAVTAAQNNEYDVDKAKELATLNAAVLATDLIEMVEGKYYRIQNYFRKDAAGNGKMLGVDSNGNRVAVAAGKSDVSLIWKFEDCTENNEVGYKIYSPNYKKYMQPAGNNGLTDTYDNGGRYRMNALGGAQFNLQTGGSSYLVIYEHGGVGGWTAASKDSDGAWYIIPATDIEVALNAGEGSYWASTYLPFAVSAPEGSDLEICTGTVNGEYLNLKPVETLPAEMGAILNGTAGTGTLNIEYTEPIESSALQGTLTEQTGITQFDYLVLGIDDGQVGLYTPNKATLKANKAYLPATAVAQGVNGLRFSFGQATGIGSAAVESTTGNAPVYDLSGRRVTAPAKGIYVKDGKKIFVR